MKINFGGFELLEMQNMNDKHDLVFCFGYYIDFAKFNETGGKIEENMKKKD